jgi:hypothetical protein
MSLYHTFSFIKIGVALTILWSLYFTINPYEDPLIALSWWIIGFFLLAWGLSFFIFWWRNTYITKKPDSNTIITNSYKLSLLFGIYILFNLIFLLQSKRTVLWWIVLLIAFILIQWILLPNTTDKKEKEH